MHSIQIVFTLTPVWREVVMYGYSLAAIMTFGGTLQVKMKWIVIENQLSKIPKCCGNFFRNCTCFSFYNEPVYAQNDQNDMIQLLTPADKVSSLSSTSTYTLVRVFLRENTAIIRLISYF